MRLLPTIHRKGNGHRFTRLVALAGTALWLISASACASTATYAGRSDVERFIADMVAKHGFEAAELDRLFQATHPQPRIIETITRPAEGKPWHQYRPIFVNKARIEGGVAFWQANSADLERAEREYGVPASIIVAIIGVETRYGGNTGSYRVLDALSTLAFDYPPRAPFFKGELEQYLLLTREEGLDPLALKGSYAGAMGKPQFISSSYRRYAVDFNGDGRRDIWDDSADAIGSVAHYLHIHGWQPGAPVAARARLQNGDDHGFASRGLEPNITVSQLAEAGITSEIELPGETPAALIAFESETGTDYWLGLQNFYAITRYNHSPLYAMAVYHLSQEIQAQHIAQLRQP